MILKKIQQIRALVCYLGEKPNYNWWDSEFLTDAGISFLENCYPRTPYLGAVNSITEAARKLHNQRIAKDGSWNLFKLPGQSEEKIYKSINNSELSEFFSEVQSKEEALDKLKSFCKQEVQSPAGPVQIGKKKDILTNNGISEMAAHYYDAFKNKKQVFTYFK